MSTNTTHHVFETFSPKARNAYLLGCVERLQKRVHAGGRPLLMFSGLSGTTLATAVATEFYNKSKLELDMMYVRRQGERAETVGPSDAVEWYSIAPGTSKFPDVFFVDDFTCQYTTLKRCTKHLLTDGEAYREARNLGIVPTDRDVPTELKIGTLLTTDWENSQWARLTGGQVSIS